MHDKNQWQRLRASAELRFVFPWLLDEFLAHMRQGSRFAWEFNSQRCPPHLLRCARSRHGPQSAFCIRNSAFCILHSAGVHATNGPKNIVVRGRSRSWLKARTAHSWPCGRGWLAGWQVGRQAGRQKPSKLSCRVPL